jgi:hypothetical protein
VLIHVCLSGRLLRRLPWFPGTIHPYGLDLAKDSAPPSARDNPDSLSWFGLGLFYGIGYCPSTDWHWRIKRARRNRTSNFICEVLSRPDYGIGLESGSRRIGRNARWITGAGCLTCAELARLAHERMRMKARGEAQVRYRASKELGVAIKKIHR